LIVNILLAPADENCQARGRFGLWIPEQEGEPCSRASVMMTIRRGVPEFSRIRLHHFENSPDFSQEAMFESSNGFCRSVALRSTNLLKNG